MFEWHSGLRAHCSKRRRVSRLARSRFGIGFLFAKVPQIRFSWKPYLSRPKFLPQNGVFWRDSSFVKPSYEARIPPLLLIDLGLEIQVGRIFSMFLFLTRAMSVANWVLAQLSFFSPH